MSIIALSFAIANVFEHFFKIFIRIDIIGFASGQQARDAQGEGEGKDIAEAQAKDAQTSLVMRFKGDKAKNSATGRAIRSLSAAAAADAFREKIAHESPTLEYKDGMGAMRLLDSMGVKQDVWQQLYKQYLYKEEQQAVATAAATAAATASRHR